MYIGRTHTSNNMCRGKIQREEKSYLVTLLVDKLPTDPKETGAAEQKEDRVKGKEALSSKSCG